MSRFAYYVYVYVFHDSNAGFKLNEIRLTKKIVAF